MQSSRFSDLVSMSSNTSLNIYKISTACALVYTGTCSMMSSIVKMYLHFFTVEEITESVKPVDDSDDK